MSKTRIAFIGAGNMAASLIGGLRAKGLDAAQIRASDPGEETRARVSAEHGIEVFADNAHAIQGADVIVLAVKPQAMKAVCEAIRPSLQSESTGGLDCCRHHLRQHEQLARRPADRALHAQHPGAAASGRERFVRHRTKSPPNNASKPKNCCRPSASLCGWTKNSNWTRSRPFPARARRTSSC